MEKLKRCPFCGGEEMKVVTERLHPDYYVYDEAVRLSCETCLVSTGRVQGGKKSDQQKVLSDVWNRRTSEAPCEIEWLQSLLDHIEKGEIELVKESIGGAISILEAK